MYTRSNLVDVVNGNHREQETVEKKEQQTRADETNKNK